MMSGPHVAKLFPTDSILFGGSGVGVGIGVGVGVGVGWTPTPAEQPHVTSNSASTITDSAVE
jgi:hypothetical protein